MFFLSYITVNIKTVLL